jgi:hypothetical protein
MKTDIDSEPRSPPKSYFQSRARDQAVAGFLAGSVTTIVLHPLDLIKTRFQGMYVHEPLNCHFPLSSVVSSLII